MSSSQDKIVRPRRKTPLRSKSTDGTDTAAAAPKKTGERRRMPPRRAKSFDGSGDKKILQKTNSKRVMRRPSDTQSKSMRGLFSTANSAKNVVAEAPNLVVKAHKLLSTKVKVRPGQMPASALSSRNITEEHAKQRNPLTKALSTKKIQSTSSRGNSRSNSKDSKEPKEEEPKTTRRGGRKPNRSLTPARANGRSLTPAKSRTPKNLKDDKDCVAIF